MQSRRKMRNASARARVTYLLFTVAGSPFLPSFDNHFSFPFPLTFLHPIAQIAQWPSLDPEQLSALSSRPDCLQRVTVTLGWLCQAARGSERPSQPLRCGARTPVFLYIAFLQGVKASPSSPSIGNFEKKLRR